MTRVAYNMIAEQLSSYIEDGDHKGIQATVDLLSVDYCERNIFDKLIPEHQTFIDSFVHGRADLEGK